MRITGHRCDQLACCASICCLVAVRASTGEALFADRPPLPPTCLLSHLMARPCARQAFDVRSSRGDSRAVVTPGMLCATDCAVLNIGSIKTWNLKSWDQHKLPICSPAPRLPSPCRCRAHRRQRQHQDPLRSERYWCACCPALHSPPWTVICHRFSTGFPSLALVGAPAPVRLSEDDLVERTRKQLTDRHMGVGFGRTSVETLVYEFASDEARKRGEETPSHASLIAAWERVMCELGPKLDALQSACQSTLVHGRCLRHRLQRCDICCDDPRSATRKSAGLRSCAASPAPVVPCGGAPFALRLYASDGSVESMPCAPTDTVQTLIDEYARRKGVDARILRLHDASARLNTVMTIADCGLCSGQRIDIDTEIEGGGARPRCHLPPSPSVLPLPVLLPPPPRTAPSLSCTRPPR